MGGYSCHPTGWNLWRRHLALGFVHNVDLRGTRSRSHNFHKWGREVLRWRGHELMRWRGHNDHEMISRGYELLDHWSQTRPILLAQERSSWNWLFFSALNKRALFSFCLHAPLQNVFPFKTLLERTLSKEEQCINLQTQQVLWKFNIECFSYQHYGVSF